MLLWDNYWAVATNIAVDASILKTHIMILLFKLILCLIWVSAVVVTGLAMLLLLPFAIFAESIQSAFDVS